MAFSEWPGIEHGSGMHTKERISAVSYCEAPACKVLRVPGRTMASFSYCSFRIVETIDLLSAELKPLVTKGDLRAPK